MNDVERSSGVKNATILMVLGGLILIYTGYQVSTILPNSFHPLFGILMIVFGILSLCAGLPIWLQKSWARTIIIGIGIAVCGTLVIFGYYLIIIFFAPWYWAAIDYIRPSRADQPPDWDDN